MRENIISEIFYLYSFTPKGRTRRDGSCKNGRTNSDLNLGTETVQVLLLMRMMMRMMMMMMMMVLMVCGI
jgi:hypothetical protein